MLALSVGNLVTKIFFWSGYLENLNGIFNPVQWLLIVILPTILLAVCTSFFVKAKYIRGYLNTQNFQYRRTDKAIAPTKIQNPYFCWNGNGCQEIKNSFSFQTSRIF